MKLVMKIMTLEDKKFSKKILDNISLGALSRTVMDDCNTDGGYYITNYTV
jgi:hypothetical protein